MNCATPVTLGISRSGCSWLGTSSGFQRYSGTCSGTVPASAVESGLVGSSSRTGYTVSGKSPCGSWGSSLLVNRLVAIMSRLPSMMCSPWSGPQTLMFGS